MATQLIHLWSGPRNVSTALMYSFAQRSDTQVVDEPLYAHYLRVSGAQHPGRDEVLAAQETDGKLVVKNRILGAWDKPVVFFKQMTHHLVDVDRAFLRRGVNVLLTRDPLEMLPSLAVQIPQPVMRDTGYAAQAALLDELRRAGQDPPVLDARQLLLDPEGVLTQLCARLKLPFEPAMLHWRAGPRPEDGVWARHWYQAVHQSTGFEPHRPKTAPFPARLQPLLEQCLKPYAHVAARALRARPAAERSDR
ncbi:MAG TPA: sulfotransferase family protein [Planctomycetota bacterium]|nr:sulfotransferase family protein [Planctomycetota bacterium]